MTVPLTCGRRTSKNHPANVCPLNQSLFETSKFVPGGAPFINAGYKFFAL